MTPAQILMLASAATELLSMLIPAMQTLLAGGTVSAEKQLALESRVDRLRGALNDLPRHWKVD
jgi:hypothetical protein